MKRSRATTKTVLEFSLVCLLSYIIGALSAHAEPQYVRQRQGSTSVIVFIHGVLGSGATTWKNDNGAYWPELLKSDPTFNKFDLYVHDYPTTFRGTNLNLDELAANARLMFDTDGVSSYKDIIFVAHSMGGLVVRSYLLSQPQISAKTRLIYFYSTPTTGAQIASLASLFSSNPQLFAMRPMDQDDNGRLASLLTNWLAAELKIPSFCAYEKESTFGQKIVTLASASNLCSERLDPILANHLTIVKPENTRATSYLALKSAISKTPQKGETCAPVFRDGSIVQLCNLARQDAKAATLDTVDQLTNKLALILSQKEMALFPAMDRYIQEPSEAKWSAIKLETTALLKLVREATVGVIAFDATLRQELGQNINTLSEQDGIRKLLKTIAAQDFGRESRSRVRFTRARKAHVRSSQKYPRQIDGSRRAVVRRLAAVERAASDELT